MENVRNNLHKEEGVWSGGLELSKTSLEGVDIFFYQGDIEIGVHNGEHGAIQTISPDNARYLAKLLNEAADQADALK